MRVAVRFTVSIDVAKYCAEYGIDPAALTRGELVAEIREHVLAESRDACEAWIERVGVGK